MCALSQLMGCNEKQASWKPQVALMLIPTSQACHKMHQENYSCLLLIDATRSRGVYRIKMYQQMLCHRMKFYETHLQVCNLSKLGPSNIHHYLIYHFFKNVYFISFFAIHAIQGMQHIQASCNDTCICSMYSGIHPLPPHIFVIMMSTALGLS